MNQQQRHELIRLINHPPRGGKIAAARDFGIDLTLRIRRLEMTPTERIQELEAAQTFVEQLRRARSLSDESIRAQS
ncbi:MAG: hypothetical protein ACRD3T_01690 [Terriglobia bacterium]